MFCESLLLEYKLQDGKDHAFLILYCMYSHLLAQDVAYYRSSVQMLNKNDLSLINKT